MVDRIDIERQEIHRESEGQDTITSLTNNQFIRAIEKLKRQESVRSNTSQLSNTSLSASTRTLKKASPSNDTSSVTSTKSSAGSSLMNKMPKSLVSLFKSNEDKLNKLYYENFLNELSDHNQHLHHQDTVDHDVETPKYKSQISCTSVTSTTSSNFSTLKKSVKLNESQKSSNTKLAAPIKDHEDLSSDQARKVKLLQSASVISSNQANTKTDEVFDALSVILKNQDHTELMENEFYEQLKLYILQSKLNRKKKLDKVKWFWSMAVYFFFFIMFLMVCYFMKTLYSIVDHINNNLAINYKNNFFRANPAIIADPATELLTNMTTTQPLDLFSTTPEVFS